MWLDLARHVSLRAEHLTRDEGCLAPPSQPLRGVHSLARTFRAASVAVCSRRRDRASGRFAVMNHYKIPRLAERGKAFQWRWDSE